MSCYLGINQTSMLMAPNYQVHKTWQEELTYGISRISVCPTELQRITSDQEA